MESQIRVYPCPAGEHQRVQLVKLDDWKTLEFLPISYTVPALDCFERIYREYLVPACPWLFGNMVLFHLPEDLEIPLSQVSRRYGALADRQTAAAAMLERGLKIRFGKPHFADEDTRALYDALKTRDCLRIVRGRLPVTTILSVGAMGGFLTEAEPEAAMKVNASFFIMDRFDCATAYDQIGTPLGLCVKNGVVENPPLFDREALLVKADGTVSVEPVSLSRLQLEIGGQTFRPGENARVFSRPRGNRTPVLPGKKLVIIGCRVAAVAETASVPIPASGFVLCPEGVWDIKPGDRVCYRGMEDVQFGIQVGNSILRAGEKTLTFRSRFYNIRHLEPVPFPPSLYPMNFHKSRAARIALGADETGKPMLLWAEGAAKVGHQPGLDSRGATLADMARFCSDAGMVNAVNLDGGGSAQILMEGRRHLQISDRNSRDLKEVQRPVPLGLMVR